MVLVEQLRLRRRNSPPPSPPPSEAQHGDPAEVTAFRAGFANSPEKQAQWASFRRKSRLEEAPESLAEIVGQIASFAAPVLGTLADGRPFQANWTHPGPWA